MKTAEIDQVLGDLAAGQWGMLTTAQANERGISRANLVNREGDGRLERMVHGVYRLGGSASSPLDDIRAAWLSTNPTPLAHERVGAPDVVVGSAAAALIHGIGDLDALPYLMISPERHSTRRTDITYSTRDLDPGDVVVRDGLPVTSVERTIADLLRDHGDLSLIADALRDAIDARADLDETRMATLLAPLARRYKLREGDGAGLYARLLAEASRDDGSLALKALLTNPILRSAMDAILKAQQAQTATAIDSIIGPIAKQQQASLKPIIDSLAKNLPVYKLDPAILRGIQNVAKINLPEGVISSLVTVPKMDIALSTGIPAATLEAIGKLATSAAASRAAASIPNPARRAARARPGSASRASHGTEGLPSPTSEGSESTANDA
ncbi:hypothetical protein GCM10025867_50050 (plasmid) [Frondihabitans sucicola]|uniref:AbiEi antitoxin N-terminal domain-containing protein n=1 Tax=Frondihabitans sucicola TaxID=1268041 RepID=A0ABM8GWC2_9MICO|nr:type IV toxin-antitoxin system AbiEi family antitoxin domain-containing protein [Frondihabitans sucicola]BDZ52764.1 hypothetical protein GCM10025867_50050 [Frondihabitans sucicola]